MPTDLNAAAGYRILIADDEPEIRQILELLLTEAGYTVVTARDGREAVELMTEEIDLYLLDVNMPRMSGFAAGAMIREHYLAPIIFLTAYSGEADKQMGFLAGADDYLVKPFSNTELLLRVKALLRRAKGYSALPPKKTELRYKDLVLDPDSQSVLQNGAAISLTYTEFQILQLLLANPRKIYSLENLYQSIWQEEAVGDSAIMVHIKNIRKKLGDSSRDPKYIKTAWGKGYYVEG